MSKENNLTDFLTDVADAIREKKGTTEKINPQNFSEEIRGIESGGNDGFNAKVEIADRTICSPKSITRAVVDEGVLIIEGFSDSTKLVEIVIPEGVTTFKGNTFQNCKSLSKINFPKSLSKISMNCFHDCIAIPNIELGDNVSMVEVPFGANMQSLTSLSVSKNNPKYDSRDECNAIIETSTNKLIAGCNVTVIPDTVTTIGVYAFRMYQLKKMYFPPSVVTIESTAFNGCSNMELYDFHDHESIPNLANINAFAGVSTYKIVVPDTLYDEWIAATNWSSLASRIVKASEYVEPTTE